MSDCAQPYLLRDLESIVLLVSRCELLPTLASVVRKIVP